MPGMSFDNDAYRYGFNGMEKDDEVKGSGNSYTTHFRQLDPRIGRWFSIDPVVHPSQSPYAAIDNSPIYLNDPDGDCTDGDCPAVGEFVNSETGDVWSYEESDGLTVSELEIWGYAPNWEETWVDKTENVPYVVIREAKSYQIEAKFGGDVSAGVQAGEEITGLEGFKFNLGSWSLWEGEQVVTFDLVDGVVVSPAKSKFVFTDGSTVKQSISISGPMTSLGAEHSFKTSDPSGTSKTKVALQVGVPLALAQFETEQDNSSGDIKSEVKVGGALGGGVIFMGEIKYEATIKKRVANE